MTTVRQLITDAMRESGILAVGVEPDAEEQTEALRALHRLLRSLFGYELGERLRTINFGTGGITNPYAVAEDYSSDIESMYTPSNLRIVFNNTAAVDVDLDPKPQDGARLAVLDNRDNMATYNVVLRGNGRQIESASSVTLATNGLNREWFFRADLNDWVRVSDPELTDVSPLPAEFDDFLITLLAFRLNPRYGAETSANTVAILTDMKRKFRSRYRQEVEMPLDDALVFLPSNPISFNVEFDFNRG